MKLVHGAVVLLVAVLSACQAPPLRQSCPLPGEITPDMLRGNWSVQIDGHATPWALTLSPHPEHTDSLKGEIRQGRQRYLVVADLDDGEFTMEESHDGKSIAATWLGRPGQDQCGKVVEGERQGASPGTVQRFRMHR